jgi:hypothetical protein
MVVRGRGTPAGRDETPHSTGSLLAPPSRPERTRHPGTLCVSYRTMWARGAAARIRTAGGSRGAATGQRGGSAGLHGLLRPNPKPIGFEALPVGGAPARR